MKWAFKWLHPDVGIGLASRWSRASRLSNENNEERFKGDREFLIQYCRKLESESHRDFYVFGHRHLPLDIDLSNNSKYYNLGEWVNGFTYGVFDGDQFYLKEFKTK